jgi:hypothetical protein
LLINSLKPYVDVKTVGFNSYGKTSRLFPKGLINMIKPIRLFTRPALSRHHFAGLTTGDLKQVHDVSKDLLKGTWKASIRFIISINTGVFYKSLHNTIAVNLKTQTTPINDKSTGVNQTHLQV